MNRTDRRKYKVHSGEKDPVYTIKRSDFKEFIQTHAEFMGVIEDLSRKAVIKETEKMDKAFDTAVLFTLCEDFHFSSEDLWEFADKFNESFREFRWHYEDCDIFMMQKKLKESGIDIDEFERKMNNG